MNRVGPRRIVGGAFGAIAAGGGSSCSLQLTIPLRVERTGWLRIVCDAPADLELDSVQAHTRRLDLGVRVAALLRDKVRDEDGRTEAMRERCYVWELPPLLVESSRGNMVSVRFRNRGTAAIRVSVAAELIDD